MTAPDSPDLTPETPEEDTGARVLVWLTIVAAIAGAITNLCRCGIYPRLVEAIQRAASAMRGDEPLATGARPGIDPREAARIVPALDPGSQRPR